MVHGLKGDACRAWSKHQGHDGLPQTLSIVGDRFVQRLQHSVHCLCIMFGTRRLTRLDPPQLLRHLPASHKNGRESIWREMPCGLGAESMGPIAGPIFTHAASSTIRFATPPDDSRRWRINARTHLIDHLMQAQ
jgi:hypothetical protein